MKPYSDIWNEVKTGDLIEWRTSSIIGWLIRLRTGENRNHSSMVVRLDLEDEKRRHIIEANEMVEFNLLSDRLRYHRGSAYWSPLKPEFDDKREVLKNWAIEQRGKPYDWGGFFFSLLGHVSYDIRRYFCSELVCAGLVHAGIIKCPDKAPWPGEFARFNCYGPEVRIK